MATKQTNRKPTHEVFHVRGEGDNTYWTKIGAAWAHDDQGGLNLQLDLMPISAKGRLVVRVRKEANAQGEAA